MESVDSRSSTKAANNNTESGVAGFNNMMVVADTRLSKRFVGLAQGKRRARGSAG